MFRIGRVRVNHLQSGQALLIAVLAMTALIGMVALTIDVGMLFQNRRHYQNSADAMALAGVAELPTNPGLAITKARTWATNNNVSNSQIKTIQVRTTGYPNDTLYVELEGQFNWTFGRVVGMTTSNVGAEAAARIGTLSGGHNMMPWALLRGSSPCLNAQGNAIFGMSCAVKVGAQDPIANGWRGALDYDGNGGGANEYRDNIIDGTTDWSYCIAGQDPPPCHSVVDALSGNKVGPTDQGIIDRLAQGAKCDANGNGKDDFDEVFKPSGQVSPAYTVNCPDSPWLIIIPIVSFSSTPVKDVTIRGWTLAYLQSYGCFSGLSANITGDNFVSARPMPGGGESIPDATLVTAVQSKPCDKNQPNAEQAQPAVAQAATPAQDDFVMAIDPGSALSSSLRAPEAPPACHNGQPHGQQLCTPSPTPTKTPSPATATPTKTPTPGPATPTPTKTPGPTPTPTSVATPSPLPTATPGPAPASDCKNGKGHWEVSIKIADASYSQNAGFLGNYDPTNGILIRRLIQ